MIGGLVTPSLLLAGPAGVNLGTVAQLYLVSACLIWCGIGTCIQVSRVKIWETNYYFGTGLTSVTVIQFPYFEEKVLIEYRVLLLPLPTLLSPG